jgi:histone H3/H4
MGISKNTIKKLVSVKGTRISDEAAERIAHLLESKAKRIARYAVDRARRKSRTTVMAEDVEKYRLKFGD